MYVGTVMRTELVTVPPDTTLLSAQKTLDAKQINHLLVVDSKGELLGIVSDRDLKKSWASSATTLSKNELMYLLDQVTVESIMAKKTLTIAPGTTIERAALLISFRVLSISARVGERFPTRSSTLLKALSAELRASASALESGPTLASTFRASLPTSPREVLSLPDTGLTS